ncbi:hypothetical protein EFA46_015220 (plasmid) [Halarchaeum sp. CBA1220]|uniref:hypothetical protein n=1 Tax=Halarchaeum sp. CBA1220 TaxID=1853682 RepID=UPI000F3A960A|nr:hypothetical protein [Halarchaeum sp. CBA1220]QLC35578.1 hypothetical protein EFA46_015220 [Halarchaeum sp. CBA1220]
MPREWPAAPATVRRRTRVARATTDPSVTLATAVDLLAHVGATSATDEAVDAGVRSLTAATPTIAPAVVSRLAALIDARLDRASPSLSGTAVSLLCDLVAANPRTVESSAETLRRLDRLGSVDRRIDALIATLGRARPSALASLLDVVTAEDTAGHGIRPARGWALAGAARACPDAFTDSVDVLRTTLIRSEPSDRAEAARRLGVVGLVAPTLVAPAIPALVDASTAPTGSVRSAAIEALGRITGTERASDGRFGHPADDLDPDLFDALDAALWSEDTAVAATALGRVGAAETGWSSRVAATLCVRLRECDEHETETTKALIDALGDVVPDTSYDGFAVRRCLDVVDDASEERTLDAAYAVLEACAGSDHLTSSTRRAVRSALAVAINPSETPVRGAAFEAVDAWLRATETPGELADALYERLTIVDSPPEGVIGVLDAIEATPVVRERLRAAFADRDTSKAAAQVICRHDDPRVRAALVAELVADGMSALRDGERRERPEKTGLFAVDAHLTDEQRAYTAAIETVAEDAPEALAPHATALADLVVDEAVSSSQRLLRALADVATNDPEALRPAHTVLEERLADGAVSSAAAASLLTIVAATRHDGEATDWDELLGSYRHADLGGAFGALGTTAPRFALASAPVHAARLQADDAHGRVGSWLHQLPPLVRTDARFAPAIPRLVVPAFRATDEWVRRDAAAVFADLAASVPEQGRRFRAELEAASYDTDRRVSARALKAFGAVDGPERDAVLDYASAHPDPLVQEAADTPLASPLETDADTLDIPEYRQRRVARRLSRASAPGGDGRALDAVAEVASGDERPVVARLLADSDPVVRALTASAVPALPTGDRWTRAAVRGELGDLVASGTPLERRWAADALGRLGRRHPETAREAAAHLAAHFPATDAETRMVFAGALSRLGRIDPGALAPAVPDLVACCDADETTLRLLAADALTRAVPGDVASVPTATDAAVRLANSDLPRLARLGDTLLQTLAATDPETLTGHVETLIDDGLSTTALSLVAAEFPDAVRPHEDAIADRGNGRAVRRTLARLHSTAYPELLSERATDPDATLFPARTEDTPVATGGPPEFDVFVTYLVTVPDPDRRNAALDCLFSGAVTGAALTETFAALRERCASDDDAVRQGAITSLRALLGRVERADVDGDTAASTLRALQARASADSWRERSDALAGIAALVAIRPDIVHDDRALVETLLEALGDEREWPRRHAARALGHLPEAISSSSDLSDVLRSLADGGRTDQRGAALAVGRVCPAGLSVVEAFALLDSLTTASDRWVRRYAVESAVRIADHLRDVAD